MWYPNIGETEQLHGTLRGLRRKVHAERWDLRMKLVYTLEMPDLVALNQYFLDHSDFLKSRRRKGIAIVCGIYGILGALHSLARKSFVPIIIWSLLALLYSFWYSRASRRASPKSVQKLYGADKNKGILCEHEIEINQDGIVERTQFGDHNTTFAGIERIIQTDTHGFIFIGTMNAHVIPKARITYGEYDTFMRVVSERWESQQAVGGD